MPSAEDAINPAIFDQHQHSQLNHLDLDITVVYSSGSADFVFKVYSKPGTAYACLPYRSSEAGSMQRCTGC